MSGRLRCSAAVKDAAGGSAHAAFRRRKVDGVLVQRMERGLAEVIVGYRRDPEVGPTMLLGHRRDHGGIEAQLQRAARAGQRRDRARNDRRDRRAGDTARLPQSAARRLSQRWRTQCARCRCLPASPDSARHRSRNQSADRARRRAAAWSRSMVWWCGTNRRNAGARQSSRHGREA